MSSNMRGAGGLQGCYGATRDLTYMFNNERRVSQQRNNAKKMGADEKTLMRERFKPLNQRNRKKEKVDDDNELGSLDEEKRRLRTSTLSDDSGGASGRLSSIADTSVEFDQKNKFTMSE